jgi:hypothetical protein
MMLLPFFKGVSGFGNGFPNREPIPAARIIIFIKIYSIFVHQI